MVSNIIKQIVSFIFLCIKSLIFCFLSQRTVPALPTTEWRLYEGGGFTKVRAGYTLENQHKNFCGHTSPLA
jgi:hypothetical protein